MSRTQESLFPVESPDVELPPRALSVTPKPTWGKYRPAHPVKCDDCLLVLALARGDGPPTRQARWRRKQGEDDLLLCYAHANARRKEDGLELLKGAE